MASTEEGLLPGDNETGSAKRRRQVSYAKDLELQMREREAGKLRERYQEMSVNASGWLDPEKRPDRLKPLGGEGFMTSRSNRESKVRPYHTLFRYGQGGVPDDNYGDSTSRAGGNAWPSGGVDGGGGGSSNRIRQYHLNLDTPAGLNIQPLTEATAGPRNLGGSVDQAYNFYATRDLDRPGGYGGSIVQPLVVPYVDNRPIIMPGRYESSEYHPKYNPFQNYQPHDDSLQKDIRALLGLTQAERDRNKKENEELQRRLRRELEDERRRLQDQDNDARRRMEQMRKDLEDRRREWERQMRDAQAAKKNSDEPTKTPPLQIRPPSTTLLSDMDDTRRRLIEERKKIEELLKAQKSPNYREVQLLKRPPPPPTPPDSDLANRRMVEEFNYLKHKDAETRKAFRKMYPELPETNVKLEAQQRALLRQQEEALRNINRNPQARHGPPPKTVGYVDTWRAGWMEKSLTPLPHRMRQRDKLYTAHSLDGDLDKIYRNAERREMQLDSYRFTESDEFDKLRLRSHRPVSAETLTDDTWMRPASASVI